jgi:hypothetical protein
LEGVASLSIATIDGDQLILSNFMTGNEDRHSGSSKSMVVYIKVDIASLRGGRLHGIYMGGNLPDFKPLDASRVQAFPQVVGLPKPLFAKGAVAGSFNVPTSSWGPSTLVFDIVADTPVAYFRPKDTGQSFHFTDGPKWDGTGAFSTVTAEGNGGEPDDKKLFYLRGRFIDERQIEFYMVSPAKGIEGPLRATR